jgi:hypothetical protein
MQNFWVLLQLLSSLTGQHTTADVARLAKTMMELKTDDEYIRLYESAAPIQLELNSKTMMATVEVRELKKKVGQPLYISLQDLHGVCLSRSMLKEYMTEFSIPLPPSSPVPDAMISQRAKFNGKLVWMGFKWSKQECVSQIILNYD